MNPILEIISIEPDLVEKDGTTHYIATAVLQDVYKVQTGRLDPPEWAPGQCSSGFAVDPGEEHPPLQGSAKEQLAYINSLESSGLLRWMSDYDQEPLI